MVCCWCDVAAWRVPVCSPFGSSLLAVVQKQKRKGSASGQWQLEPKHWETISRFAQLVETPTQTGLIDEEHVVAQPKAQRQAQALKVAEQRYKQAAEAKAAAQRSSENLQTATNILSSLASSPLVKRAVQADRGPITSAFPSLADFLKSLGRENQLDKLTQADILLRQLPRFTYERLVSLNIAPGPADDIAAEAGKYLAE